MSRIKQLKQAKADKTAALRKISDTLKAENRSMTADERTTVSTLETELTDIEHDIQFEERLAERERRATPIVDENERTATQQRASMDVHDRSQDDPTRGFSNLTDFARSVRAACVPAGRVDPRLLAMARGQGAIQAAAPSNPHTEAGSGEGYDVPAAFANEIFQLVFDEDDLLAAVNPEPTDLNAVDIEGDETTPWGASGVQARWRAEGTAMTGTKTVTNLRTVRLHELYAFVAANDELLADSPRLQNRLTVKSADAIRWKASEAIFAGSGAGQPLGWMKAPCLITQAAEGGQTADTIVVQNVLKMYARLLASGGKAFWVMGRDAIPQIATMTVGNQPIFTPPNAGIKDAPNGMLLGAPIRYSEHAAAIGDLGDLSLVNPAGYYATIKRGGVQFASSIHLYFDYNATAFRWTFRLGGQPYLSAAMNAAKQTSKSHFVTLAAR